MLHLDCFDDPPDGLRHAVVSIGNFDGIHRGHHRLVAHLRDWARQMGRPGIAISFDPHPLNLLRPETAPIPLCWPERKVELLQAAGADGVLLYHTTLDLLDLTANEYFERILCERLQVAGLVEGSNFGFGRSRTGNVKVLKSLCEAANIPLDVVELVTGPNKPVSSSRIRELIHLGNLTEANQLLGRPHRLLGTVVVGAERGRTIGFPTANLERIPVLLPHDGVYSARVWLENGTCHAAACNIGPNPTFAENIRKVEVHLLDFTGDLYGKRIQVDILERLRETKKFSSKDELVAQLHQDIASARTSYANNPVPEPRAELKATILEWIHAQIGPSQLPGSSLHLAGTLEENGTLLLRWSQEGESFTPQSREVILRLETNMRSVFPEVEHLVFE